MAYAKKKTLRNEKGDAMVLVLCAMMLFGALCASVLFAASLAQGNAVQAAVGERLKLLTLSFSEMLEDELLEKGEMHQEDMRSLMRQMVLEEGVTGVSESVNASDVPKPMELSCQLDGKEAMEYLEGYDIRVKVYWEGKRSEIRQKLMVASIDGIGEEQAYDGILLYVDVIGEKEEESYRIRSEYKVTIKQSEQSGECEWVYQLGGKY